MATEKATAFTQKYRVIAQADTGCCGSVTIFEDRATVSRSVSVRGTNDSADVFIGDAAVAFGMPQHFTVYGHSFGGYAAACLRTDFFQHVTSAYLYNTG